MRTEPTANEEPGDRALTSTGPEIDVVEICARLVSIDTQNFGHAGTKGERAAAAYVAELLRAAGYHPLVLESAPTRANVILRVPGTLRDAEALLVHGHLDVVPADAEHWTVPPFEGRVGGGYVWGRGATDMKDMLAMMLATLLEWARDGTRPRRDIVFAFVADEEEDGQYGAEWLVDVHPELFTDVAAAIGESGGVPVDVAAADGTRRRFYPVAAAERGSLHMSVRADGTAGHGSRPNHDNPVSRLVDGVHRLARHEWPVQLTPVVRTFLEESAAALGIAADLTREAGIAALLDGLGELRDYVEPSLRSSTTPTVLDAGYKFNVVPDTARAEIDVRTVEGSHHEVLSFIRDTLGPDVSITQLSDSPAISSPLDSPWLDAIRRCVHETDPRAVVVPYCMGGGTDAKPFAKLGIHGYGFTPLGVDPEGRVASGMHGVDERVPVTALREGQRMLRRLLEAV